MRRLLVTTTCLTPIILAVTAPPAHAAAVTITDARTAAIATSTIDSGVAGDITISSTGSVTPTTAGAAVTIDSANSVSNAGTITLTGIDGSSGIAANAGLSGSITNSGTITNSESYTQTDSNGDGVVDGAFAEGSDRFGIKTVGAFTGNIANSGTIAIQGNDSAGISLGGTLAGSLSQSGTITVRGDNSTGISAQTVTGDVGLAGTISATGSGASAVVLSGDVGGALTIQATATATGYTSTTLPASSADLGADNLLQDGPAVSVAGSVAGGVNVTAATSTTDASGATVTTTEGVITSYGSGAALQVGAASRAITIGAIAADANGFGLDIAGAVESVGLYTGYATHGLVIGGLGGTVDIAGGVAVSGTVSAVSSAASATAFAIGSGASVPSIINTGSITATSSGSVGTATAVVDSSGSVKTFANNGTIEASGGASNVALDFSADNQNITVTQAAPSSGTIVPSIIGDITFGSGADTLAVSDGTVTGNLTFGGGASTLALSGSTVFTGDADFGNGAGSTLSVGTGASFAGALNNASGTALSVTGGTFTPSNTGSIALASLAVTGGGTIGVTVDGTTGSATLYQVAGTASFDSGSKIALHFSDINHVVGTYTVIEAGTLAGADNISITSGSVPYLFTATDSASANAVDVTVTRKTAAQLGLNRAESAAYEPIVAAVSQDSAIGDSFLALGDSAGVERALRSLMPDFAGGSFDSVSLATRASARWLADPSAPVYGDGPWAFWIQQVGWLHSKSTGDSEGYKLSGWGANLGVEHTLGQFGRIGISAGYMAGQNDAKDTPNQVTDEQYEVGAYWRATWGGLHAYARGSFATVDFKSRREFEGDDDGTTLVRVANGRWNGKMLSGIGGVSYQLALGAFSLRPQASVDYVRLREAGYSETGGGTGMDLTVDPRKSTEFAANEAIALGYRLFGGAADEDGDSGYVRVELEGGRREHIGGSLGDTTASFAGGQDFTLIPDERTGGWTGALRLKGGNDLFTLSGEVDGERDQNTTALALRAGVQMGF